VSVRPNLPVVVITPFYNSEEGLTRCIESVLNQSFSNFEYILADNRSDDGSGHIARSYLEKDSRVRYRYFSEFVSQRENYNRALRELPASARYCKIVQADDFLYPSCLEEMLMLAALHPSAGVISSVRSIDGQQDPPNAHLVPEFGSGRDIARATILGKFYAFGSPTTVMYRGDLVRERVDFFRKGAFFDDTDAILELLKHSDFAFCQKRLTHTTRDPESILGRVLSFDISLLYRFMTARRIGRCFFSENELARLMHYLTRAYYDQFVRSLVHRHDRWNYLAFHRNVLRDSAAIKIDLVSTCRSFFRNLARRYLAS